MKPYSTLDLPQLKIPGHRVVGLEELTQPGDRWVSWASFHHDAQHANTAEIEARKCGAFLKDLYVLQDYAGGGKIMYGVAPDFVLLRPINDPINIGKAVAPQFVWTAPKPRIVVDETPLTLP